MYTRGNSSFLFWIGGLELTFDSSGGSVVVVFTVLSSAQPIIPQSAIRGREG